MRLARLASFELHPTSFYWAHFDNVLATHQMSQQPFTESFFRCWLNIVSLFSKQIVAPGICIYKNKIAKHLITKGGYEFILRDGFLVPLLPKDAASFTEMDYADRHDITSYRVKQDDKMAEFIKFLDANTSYMIAFDGDEYREELTINFEEQLLSSSYLKQPLFKPHSKDILQSIKEHSINNKTLRRSSFFFAGDIFSKITTKIGTELKRSASQIYHHTFADHFGLRAWLPETYDSNSQLAPMDFPVIFTDEQEGCFIQFGHFGCLKAEDIRALRESSFGQEYFLKALEFHEKRCGKEEFQRALRRYAVAIKYAIACSSMSQKQSTKDRLRITDKAIFLMGVAVPLAVYGAVSGLEKAMEHGPLFGFSGVAAEWAWHLFATRSEKKIWEKEAANSTAFILDWEKQHKNSRVVKGISPTI